MKLVKVPDDMVDDAIEAIATPRKLRSSFFW